MSDLERRGLEYALAAARQSQAEGGVPIGAALMRAGELVGSGHNERVQALDPTAHGEIACLRNSGRQTTYSDTVLYTTLAPCAMCAGAIIQFKIPEVVIGEGITFPGELELLGSRGVTVRLLQDERCVELMTQFQREQPHVWAEDIGELPRS